MFTFNLKTNKANYSDVKTAASYALFRPISNTGTFK